MNNCKLHHRHFNSTFLVYLIFFILTGSCTSAINSKSSLDQRNHTTKRSINTIYNDYATRKKIQGQIDQLLSNNQFSKIKVICFNGKVFLIGSVATEKIKVQANQIAQNTQGIKKIFNQISVNPSRANSTLKDQWLCLKTKNLMRFTKDFPSSEVKVVCSDQVIYLFGMLPIEKINQAILISKKVRGAKRIVNAIEVI